MEKDSKNQYLFAIKLSIIAITISLILGLLSLWVLLNQVTISVGIDKKINEIKNEIKELQSRK